MNQQISVEKLFAIQTKDHKYVNSKTIDGTNGKYVLREDVIRRGLQDDKMRKELIPIKLETQSQSV